MDNKDLQEEFKPREEIKAEKNLEALNNPTPQPVQEEQPPVIPSAITEHIAEKPKISEFIYFFRDLIIIIIIVMIIRTYFVAPFQIS
jgi:hypothetical protein